MIVRHGVVAFAAGALVAATLLQSCATQPPLSLPTAQPTSQVCPSCPVCPACPGQPPPPAAKPLQEARWEDLPGWADDNLAATWGAFLESCKALQRQSTWGLICNEARGLRQGDNARLRAFFESRLQPWQVVNPDDSREGLITGYYEPVIKGSRNRSKTYAYPLYAVPDDLLTIDLGDLYPDLKHMRLRGRLDGHKVVPYYSRAELTQRETQLVGKVLLWAADPIELFFLQVQGSGRVELNDGSQVRVNYADQNGHPYQSIGRWLVDKGELPLERASMEGIKAWATANPQRLNEMLDANPSYVFFRELPDSKGGPLGALGVPLTEGRSLAVDPRTVPLGAPVFLSTTWPLSTRPLNRLMLAQDTGGAIKGTVRADFFWGGGAEAGAQAGKMRQKGRMWVLLPQGDAPTK